MITILLLSEDDGKNIQYYTSLSIMPVEESNSCLMHAENDSGQNNTPKTDPSVFKYAAQSHNIGPNICSLPACSKVYLEIKWLVEAAEQGDALKAQRLIDYGADVDSWTLTGKVPLN